MNWIPIIISLIVVFILVFFHLDPIEWLIRHNRILGKKIF